MGNGKKPTPPPADKAPVKPVAKPSGGGAKPAGSTTQRPPQLRH